MTNTLAGGPMRFSGRLDKLGTVTVAGSPAIVDSQTTNFVGYANVSTGTNTVQIAEGLSVQTNLPGNQIFQNSGGDAFGALQQLITALQSGTASAAQTATNQVRDALASVSGQQIFYSNAVNQFNSTQTFLNQEQVNLTAQANNLVGADITKVATDLTQAQTAYSATLAAAAKILPTSLLDYLKRYDTERYKGVIQRLGLRK